MPPLFSYGCERESLRRNADQAERVWIALHRCALKRRQHICIAHGRESKPRWTNNRSSSHSRSFQSNRQSGTNALRSVPINALMGSAKRDVRSGAKAWVERGFGVQGKGAASPFAPASSMERRSFRLE
jgi:hypothetical protein